MKKTDKTRKAERDLEEEEEEEEEGDFSSNCHS